MRNLIVSTFVTLDGVMDGTGKAEIQSWQPQFWNDELEGSAREQLFASDALLLGRVTYQGFAEAWPSITDDTGFADRINGMAKYVVSSTLDKAEWTNSTIIDRDVVATVSELKRQPGQDILMYGCGDLAYLLARHGLVDEFQMWVHPVVVGGGVRLFKDAGETTVLNLAGTKTFGSGVAVLIYKPADRQQGS